ncbi:unnamed protein product, partial [Rotaria sp. Silwood1]
TPDPSINWTNDFIAKLSDSYLTGLLEQYFVNVGDDDLKVEAGDMDIMFEPNEAFVSNIDTASQLQIGFVETTPYFGYYYIEYNPKTKFHSILGELDIFEMRNNKQYICSRKLTDLLYCEFTKYNEHGICKTEMHGPAISIIFNDGTALQDFVFSMPMLKNTF